jgi:hypothetical protein
VNDHLAQRVLINKLGDLSPNILRKTNGHFECLAQHFQRPLTKMTMEALDTAVEEANKPRGKKSKVSKVAPATAGEEMASLA